MPVPDFAQGIQYSFLDAAVRARRQAAAQVIAESSSGAPSAAASPGAAPAKTAATDPPLTFDDLLDVVNPLQHLPIVSTLYRHFTHDEIKPLPKIAGDALYGGWMGLASSVADYTFERITGRSFGDTMLALVTGDDTAPPSTVVASAASASKPNAGVAIASARPASVPTASLTNPQVAQPPPTRLAAVASRPPLPLPGSGQPIPTIDAATLDAFMTAVNSKGLPGDLSQRTVDAYRRTVGLQSQAAPAVPTVH